MTRQRLASATSGTPRYVSVMRRVSASNPLSTRGRPSHQWWDTAQRIHPVDHDGAAAVQAALVADASNSVLASAVTIYSWSGALAPLQRGGVPVRFSIFFYVPFGTGNNSWRHTGGQESTFRDISELLLKQERYYVRDIVPITVLCGCEMAFPLWCGRNVYAIGGCCLCLSGCWF